MIFTAQCAIRKVAVAIAALLYCASPALAQLNQNCTVSVLNRTVQVNADGSWVLPNVPANFGKVKARATCVQNGVTTFGESDFFVVNSNQASAVPTITLGAVTPIPVALAIGPTSPSLTATDQTIQLTVTASYPDGSTKDVSPNAAGTNYTISNPTIATISADGLVTAKSSGTVVIQADNDGATGIISVSVTTGPLTPSGLPLDWVTKYGLNAADPLLALEDPDRDGLTNLQENQQGTNPNNPDSDGDGLNDGDEVNKYGTLPAVADTDGDGIPDGIEVRTGTLPKDPTSYSLAKALQSFTVTPASFTLSFSQALGEATQQLAATGLLIDGKTPIVLTSRQTQYVSSNNAVCIAAQNGLVTAIGPGVCTITATNNGFTATSVGTISGFTPTALSWIAIPGFANAVKVAGNYAYVAAGAAGLQVLDVSDKRNPRIAASLTITGNANELRIVGTTLYLATSTGLSIIDISNALQPKLTGSAVTPGTAWDVAISGDFAYVADGTSGLQVVNVSNPASPRLIGSLAVSGSTTKGVDVASNTAILAASGGVVVVDISSPGSPIRIGSVTLPGDARKVVLQGSAAFVADYTGSLQVVDIGIPSTLKIVGSTSTTFGGILQDIALTATATNTFVLGADVYFVNGVPIVDVTQPANPIPLPALDFSKCTGCRDDNGHGIAADAAYVYLTAERGTSDLGITGDTRLYIGQYRQIVDNGGTAPSVQVTLPQAATTLVQGERITFAASASDDVAVASVNLTVDGQVVSTITAPPYQVTYTVPQSALMLTFGATALDYGNNLGVAQNVQAMVIPDPLTTVVGRVVDSNGNPLSGANVSAFGKSSITVADGSFAIAQVPTILGNVQVLATFLNSSQMTLAGLSVAVPPLRAGITNAGTITAIPVPVVSTIIPKAALAGFPATLQVNGTTLSGVAWKFLPVAETPIAIQVGSTSSDGKSATLNLTIPTTAVGTYTLVATNLAGDSVSSPQANRFTVVDPNSTADTDGDGFQDAIEAVLGTDPLDPNSFPVIVSATEASSVAFSVLNAPVTRAGIQETTSVGFSLLNAPVTGSGIQELSSVPFSILNAPIGTAGIVEAGSYFSVCNGPSCPAPTPAMTASVAQSVDSKAKLLTSSSQTETSPAVDPLADSDNDGLPDWFELLIGTDPQSSDTDNDGLSDFEEVSVYHTNPLDSDTDGDGFEDGEEVLFGSDPLSFASTPITSQRQVVAKAKGILNSHTVQGDVNDKARPKKLKERKAASTVAISSNRSPSGGAEANGPSRSSERTIR